MPWEDMDEVFLKEEEEVRKSKLVRKIKWLRVIKINYNIVNELKKDKTIVISDRDLGWQ